jgi:hypothetical protein
MYYLLKLLQFFLFTPRDENFWVPSSGWVRSPSRVHPRRDSTQPLGCPPPHRRNPRTDCAQTTPNSGQGLRPRTAGPADRTRGTAEGARLPLPGELLLARRREPGPGEGKGPAGPSSRAAYQTRRASTSFGRPSGNGATQGGDLDFAPWHTPQGRRTCGFWPDEQGSSQGTRRTEPAVVVAVRRRIPVTVGGTHVQRIVVEGAATQQTAIRPPSCGRDVPGTTAPAVDRNRPGGRGPSSS